MRRLPGYLALAALAASLAGPSPARADDPVEVPATPAAAPAPQPEAAPAPLPEAPQAPTADAPPAPAPDAAPAAPPAADAPPARFDTVTLKDGRVLRGVVDDRGETIILRSEGRKGAVVEQRFRRAEIVSIDLQSEAPRPRDELDVVILLSGDEVAGKVEMRSDGRQVAVIIGDRAASGEILLDRRQVREILWSQRASDALQKADGGGIGRSVERLLQLYADGDARARVSAREQLLELGVFALPYLEVRKNRTATPEVAALVGEVLAAARARTVISSYLLQRLPDLPRRIIDADPAVREQAVRDAVTTSPRDAVPLLVFVVKGEPNAGVRALIMGQLSLQGRMVELIELAESEGDPALKFSAAIALGDNGVLVGVPLMIDALDHPSTEIRRVAIDALQRWTSQTRGYFADPLPGETQEAYEAKRQAAIERWTAWFEEEGADRVEQSLRATVRRDLVSPDDEVRGQQRWLEAQVRWNDILQENLEGEARKDAFEHVRFLLLQSLEAYPHFVSARLALAELSYSELGDTAGARRELDLVLRRYGQDGGVESVWMAQCHLGAIARLERKWTEAMGRYQTASTLRSDDFRALAMLGEVHYDRALLDAELDADGRRDELERSLKVYEEALKRLTLYQQDVEGSKEAADAVVTEDNPFARGPFLEKLGRMEAQLKSELAALYFRAGRSYAALHDDKRALEAYELAKELEPGNLMYEAASAIWTKRRDADASRPAEAAPPAEATPGKP